MLELITQETLKVANGLGGSLIRMGEGMVAFAVRLGADEAYDMRAPYSEIWINNRGENVTALGVRVEDLVDRLSGVQASGAN